MHEYLGVSRDLDENNLVSIVHTGKLPRFQLLKEYVLEFPESGGRACAMCPIFGFKVHTYPIPTFIVSVHPEGCFMFIPFYFVVYSIYTRTCIVAIYLLPLELPETTGNLMSLS